MENALKFHSSLTREGSLTYREGMSSSIPKRWLVGLGRGLKVLMFRCFGILLGQLLVTGIRDISFQASKHTKIKWIKAACCHMLQDAQRPLDD